MTGRGPRISRAAREQQILDVAAAEIARVGFAALSLAEVAELAGISKPLVYGYFGTKDGLYAACVARAGQVLTEHIGAAIADPGPSPADVAQRTISAIFTALHPRPHDWAVVFDRTLPEHGVAADAARVVRRRIAEQAASGAAAALAGSAVDDPLDLSAWTEVWMGIVTSLVHWWLRHPEQSPQQMADRFRRLLVALSGADS